MPAAISCVTFPVDDLQKSIAFYRDGLGLAIEEQDEEHDQNRHGDQNLA